MFPFQLHNLCRSYSPCRLLPSSTSTPSSRAYQPVISLGRIHQLLSPQPFFHLPVTAFKIISVFYRLSVPCLPRLLSSALLLLVVRTRLVLCIDAQMICITLPYLPSTHNAFISVTSSPSALTVSTSPTLGLFVHLDKTRIVSSSIPYRLYRRDRSAALLTILSSSNS